MAPPQAGHKWSAETPYYHTKTNTWGAEPENYADRTVIGPYGSRPVSSHYLPPAYHPPGITGPQVSSHSPSSFYSPDNYNSKPWDGLDKKKFPRTYGWMVKFFFSGEYYKDTKYVYRRTTSASTAGKTEGEDSKSPASSGFKSEDDYLAWCEGYYED